MRFTRLATIATIGVAACAPVDSDLGVSYHRPVVVEAVLIANQPVQTFTILWASTNSDPQPTDGPQPADVRLWIVSPTGDSIPIVATGTNGTFTAALAPQPGMTYRLTGSIIDSVVSAQTTIPSLHIDTPHNGDTAAVAADSLLTAPFRFADVPVHITATGARAYSQMQIELHGTRRLVTASYFSYLPFGGFTFGLNDSTLTGYIYAVAAFDPASTFFYQPDVAQPDPFRLKQPPPGILCGALGTFGSEATDSVFLTIPR